MPEGHTSSPTIPQPTGAPSSPPTEIPTSTPIPATFCEVTVAFQQLKIIDDGGFGPDQWDDTHTQLFQESLHELNPSYIPSPDWVCYISVGTAIEKISEPDPPWGIEEIDGSGNGNRFLRAASRTASRLLRGDSQYVGIHVDFTVTAPFVSNGDTCNDDNAAFTHFANSFYEDVSLKLGNGELQELLRKHGDDGSSQWLSGVIVR